MASNKKHVIDLEDPATATKKAKEAPDPQQEQTPDEIMAICTTIAVSISSHVVLAVCVRRGGYMLVLNPEFEGVLPLFLLVLSAPLISASSLISLHNTAVEEAGNVKAQLDKLEEEIEREKRKVDLRFLDKKKPLMRKRNDVLAKIQNFWAIVESFSASPFPSPCVVLPLSPPSHRIFLTSDDAKH